MEELLFNSKTMQIVSRPIPGCGITEDHHSFKKSDTHFEPVPLLCIQEHLTL